MALPQQALRESDGWVGLDAVLRRWCGCGAWWSEVILVAVSQVYVLEVTWSEGTKTIIYRRYSRFFEFQVSEPARASRRTAPRRIQCQPSLSSPPLPSPPLPSPPIPSPPLPFHLSHDVFQCKLLEIFPEDAGEEDPAQRMIPFLPGGWHRPG